MPGFTVRSRALLAALLMGVGGATPESRGQVDGTFIGGVGNWNSAGSWTGGVPDAGGTATFTGGGTQTVTLPALYGTTLSRMVFTMDPDATVTVTSSSTGVSVAELNNNQARISGTASGGLTLTVTGTEAVPTVRSRISGTGGLTKDGPGTLWLGSPRTGAGGHNFTGPTRVNEGTLRLLNHVPGTSEVTVAEGTSLEVRALGTSVRTAATLVDGALSLGFGSRWVMTGPTTVGATSNVSVLGGGDLQFRGVDFSIDAGIVVSGTIGIDTESATTFTLNRGVGGEFAITGSSPSAGTMTVLGDVLIGNLPVLLGAVSLSEGSTLRVDSATDLGTNTGISYNDGGVFDVQRGGSFTLRHSLSSARLANPPAPPPGQQPEPLPVMEIRTQAGSQVTLAGDIYFSGVIVAGDDVVVAPSGTAVRTFSAGSFEPAPGAFIDLRNHAFVLFNSTEAETAGLVATWLASTPGGEAGLGSSRAGTGGPGSPDFYATVGVRRNIDGAGLPLYRVFGGEVGATEFTPDDPLLETDVLVKYTYRGDTNLDGTLDATDFNAILNGWSNGLSGWANGDINYDGVVDATDFGLFLPAYQFVLGGGAPFGAGGNAGGAIPEPAAVGLLLPAAALVGRRRR